MGGDVSMIALLLSLILERFPPYFICLLLNRRNGKRSHHPNRQESHGPACSDLRESEKQAQRPRGRLLQVQLLSSRLAVKRMHFQAATTWGQHFTKKSTRDYRLHSQLNLWVFYTVARLATWLPAFLPVWLICGPSLCAPTSPPANTSPPHSHPPCVSVSQLAGRIANERNLNLEKW